MRGGGSSATPAEVSELRSTDGERLVTVGLKLALSNEQADDGAALHRGGGVFKDTAAAALFKWLYTALDVSRVTHESAGSFFVSFA